MQKKFNIITHNGTFHADECMGITLIRHFADPLADVTRTRDISQHHYDDPNTIVLDVGGRCEIEGGNLDHHHDESLESSVILTLDYLLVHHYIDGTGYDFLVDHPIIKTIDRIDRTGYKPEDAASINRIVRSLNGVQYDFEAALDFCAIVLDGIMNQYQLARDSRHAWDKCTKDYHIAISRGSQIITGWHKWAEQEEILFLVVPSSNPNRAKVISRDSNKFPIENNPYHSFLHNARFVAEYTSWNTAISHAIEMAAKYISNQ